MCESYLAAQPFRIGILPDKNGRSIDALRKTEKMPFDIQNDTAGMDEI
jgi:hypothetical protein